MELNTTSIHDVVHPTAAFSQTPYPVAPPSPLFYSSTISSSSTPDDPSGCSPDDDPWSGSSQLNPKNRIDSLDPPTNPLWRIDGCTGLGTQYYALPLFLGDVPPLRFDVFIPEEAGQGHPVLRRLLDLDAAFHTKDPTRVRRLGVANHILRTLQTWTTSRGGREVVAEMYKTLPFGSRIIFEDLDVDVNKITITIAPTYYVEKQMLSLARLDAALGIARGEMPETIDIGRLRHVQQLHDSVCVVRMDGGGGGGGDGEGGGGGVGGEGVWILKALTSGTKYLYSELRTLLNLPPHPHVIRRPEYLVTKYCRFGGKTAVVGFLLPYHRQGSLRDHLAFLRMHDNLPMELRLKWATQLTSAVRHIRSEAAVFYPDLRLDNVVLSKEGDIVMVDFEQRGVWCEFAAPEVNSLEYVRILASSSLRGEGGYDDDDDDAEGSEVGVVGDGDGDMGDNSSSTMAGTIPREVRDRYAQMLEKQLPGWEALQAREDYQTREELGVGYESYNVPWEALDAREQEAAEVYMLGRVLWCIFEGQSAPQKAAVWQSYKYEPDIEFPQFKDTPAEIRGLIEDCTRGRREVLSRLVTRRGSKLVLRRDVTRGGEEVRRAAKEWWTKEVQAAEEFLKMRDEMKAKGEWTGNYYGRPSLKEVVDALDAFKASIAT
ncbi:ribosomal protein S6 kinase alpha-5 [Diplogelasinospora grovesii]|uniref:Ribosomal protein S6 kinase alpha-5 n=1 Tax=Diplogelasinospora grovesii TaxID=303347 RepID=A0AAN6S157_9PEZI|nr:ribosomal protein S6 kinase alpha-5 [Diplogelasinospora grovesii]